jgi:hypothetical protein
MTGGGAQDDHTGTPMDRSGPAEHPGHHCPPVDCVVVMHCVTGTAELSTSVAVPAAVSMTSLLAPRASEPFRGRDLEPPTPPPNRVS